MQGLVNENRLIDLQIKLFAFENEFKSAITELSALMGLPPGNCLELATGEFEDIDIGDLCINEFEKMALRYRPELYAQEMQYTIDAEEVKASMIEMLPNARLFASIWHDDDMFIYVNDWFKFGTTLSWNLLQLPAKWANSDSLDTRSQISWETRLSMSMGVLTQVHLSYINIQESKVQYSLAKDLYKVKHRQLEVANVLERSGELSIDDVLVFEVESLFARVNAIKAFSNLQIALEQLGNSVGRPMLLTGPLNAFALGLENSCACYEDTLPFDTSKFARKPAEIFLLNDEVIDRGSAEQVEEDSEREEIREEQEQEEQSPEDDSQNNDTNAEEDDDELKMLEKSYNSYIREHKAQIEKNVDIKSLTPKEAPQGEPAPVIPPPSLDRAVRLIPVPSIKSTPEAAPASSSLTNTLNAPSPGLESLNTHNPNSDRHTPNLSQQVEKREQAVHGPQYVK
jgi:hypothetical protein